VKILHAKIWKNNVPIGWCRADGIMVASQVGSTGYSLSAGGPILDPETDTLVLTPVCPLTIFHPIVFPAKSTIKIQIVRPDKVLVVLDGTQSQNYTSFIRFETNFYQRLKGRLLFSEL